MVFEENKRDSLTSARRTNSQPSNWARNVQVISIERGNSQNLAD